MDKSSDNSVVVEFKDIGMHGGDIDERNDIIDHKDDGDGDDASDEIETDEVEIQLGSATKCM
eukprot:4876961-Ditylum_brightwellii.AAC.1